MVSVLAVIVTGSPGLGLRVFQIRRHGVQIIFSHVLRTVLNHFGHCTKGSGDVSAIRFKEIHLVNLNSLSILLFIYIYINNVNKKLEFNISFQLLAILMAGVACRPPSIDCHC